MDYIPPERPALIAQARGETRRHVGKILDTGQIDLMYQLDDFEETTTCEEQEKVRKFGLKPGQYFPLCKAAGDSLVFYLQEHKPCSVPTYAAFVALTKLKPRGLSFADRLSDKQLAPIKEILGEKLDSSKYTINAHSDEVDGRKALYVSTVSKKNPATIGTAFYVVADPKKRIVEEIGFKDAKKDNNKYWLDEATQMLASLKLVKEKPDGNSAKK